MFYERAQCIIDNDPETRLLEGDDFDNIRNDLLLLRGVYRKLHQKRLAAGALELHSIEVKFELDDKRNPVAVSPSSLRLLYKFT